VSTATWEFEPADPEVGFFSDTVTHACAANEDEAQPAEAAHLTLQTVTRRRPNGTSEQMVAETTTFRCPACGATTATTDHWPLSFFEEPR